MENFGNIDIIKSKMDYKDIQEIDDIQAKEFNEIETPSGEELEMLKESDFEEYLSWIDIISKKEQIKHGKEIEEIAKEEAERARKEEMESLYRNQTKEQKRNSFLYRQD
jgi:hypothetical protein